MKKICLIVIATSLLIIGCTPDSKPKYEIAGEQSRIIKEMIDAVNEKNAEKYVAGFALDVQVFAESQMKVEGKENLTKNRAKHFEKYPQVRSEIQHLVEIDNKVILHDKVWLHESDKVGQNVVEIFTFTGGKVSRVDVIQPQSLFQNR